MTARVTDILNWLNQIAPFGLAESWDNVGLLIGDPGRDVQSILFGLDPSLSLLDEAIARNIDTIITHHPCIFRPLPVVHVKTPGGAFVERALTHRINVIACHTNFDSAEEGVSDVLGELLNLEGLEPIHAAPGSEVKSGLGRIGEYPAPLDFSDFMQNLFEAVATSDVQLAGSAPEQVKRVALCGGSGSELAEEAMRLQADVYISAEIKHSTAVWARDAGFCVIDAGHYGTEKPAVSFLADKLESYVKDQNWQVTVHLTETEISPFTHMRDTEL